MGSNRTPEHINQKFVTIKEVVMANKKMQTEPRSSENSGERNIDMERVHARKHEVPLMDFLKLSFLFSVLLFALFIIEHYQ